MTQHDVRPALALRRLINGYQVSQAIHVAAVLGIADQLHDGPMSSDVLAERVGAYPDALYRLLRALASADVLWEEPDHRFRLTELGECLHSDAPEPVADWAQFVGQPYHWQAWGDLLHSVRTGENAFHHVHGADPWTFRSQRPELSAAFDRAMAANARLISSSLLSGFDFSPFDPIVDVGGGNGALLAAILQRHTQSRGVVFDQPHVVSHAEQVLETAGVARRCEIVGGSFFESVPAGGSAYLLKSIIHDWEDAEAGAILATCRRAMESGAALLVIERHPGNRNGDPDAKFSDLNMLVNTGGRERSEAEYRALFKATGFRYIRFTPTGSGIGVFEGAAA
jgi:hypothetical protein